MIRSATLFPVLLALILPALPGAVLAQDAKAANCAATAEIVRLAVEERAAGKDSAATAAFLTSDAAGIDAKYDTAIPALVDWVWTLEPGDLQKDVAGDFEKSCLAYEG